MMRESMRGLWRQGDAKYDQRRYRRGSFFTLYVDNLPNSTGQPWFRKFFSNFGFVVNVHLPIRRSRRTGNRFGFVRYKNSKDTENAIGKTNGFWIGRRNLIVERARFDRGDIHKDFAQSTTQNHQKFSKETRGKEVWRKKGIVESSKQGELRNVKAAEASTKMNLGSFELQDLKRIESINVQPIGNCWLFRSAVAKMSRLASTEVLEHVFRREGVGQVQIKAIGGRHVIVTFPDIESRDSTIKEGWIANWFEEINPWKGEQAKEERYVWLSCYGMPLNAWSSSTFKAIGNKWGQFLQVNESTLKEYSYVKATILIATDQVQKIEGCIELIVDKAKYTVRVEEQDTFRFIQQSTFTASSDFAMEKKIVSEEGEVKARSKEEVDKHDVGQANHGDQEDKISDEVADSNISQKFACSGVQLNNEMATETNSISSSLGIETSMVGNEKVLDTLEDAENEKEIENTLEELEYNCNENRDEGPNLDPLEDNQIPIQAAVKGIKGKKKRKSINDILGFSKVNSGNLRGGRSKNKCVVLRSAVAAAALSASISSDGMNNRNRILLDEARTIWEINKLHGIGYDGDEEEVISKIAELEAQNKVGADCEL